MEAQGGTFALHNVQGSSKVLWGAHQGAVVQVPHVEAETWDVSLQALEQGLEGLSKTQWAERVPLLHTTAAMDGIFPQMEQGLTGVAGFHPGR